eukprot:TRINITY_DN18859_c0_g1_i1.p2 TRINITY_DN18859_c0_g1~~TRINITY_DN18859_c0_g1_i1.p2  ORF type:complete len:101 (-),score=20.18 TRINITY_DN18859_c0_g1_i1:40-342(-)
MQISRAFEKMPSFGFDFKWTNLMQKLYKNEATKALVKIETPFDIYVETMNLISKFPGLKILKIDKRNGLLISWEEMNEIWKAGFRSFKKIPTGAVRLLRK